MEKGANTRRRRRLVERGSDRLAFITGQTRSLSCDPLPESPSGGYEDHEFSSDTGDEKFSNRSRLHKSGPSDLVPEFQRGGIRPETRTRTLSYDDLIPEFQRADTHQETKAKTLVDTRQETKAKTLSYEDELFYKFKTGSATAVPEIQPQNESTLRRRDQEIVSKKVSHDGAASQETISKKTSHDGAASVQPTREVETRPRSAPPSQSNEADSSGWSVETLKELLDFTPQEITKAISATEITRFLASIAIAFLVILSNWGLDVGGTITRVLVGTRPLLFLILTNFTIVVTLLMENKDPNARGRPVGGNPGSADSLGQMLEIGLLLQTALGALLMDCSVCAVIMICFLGF